MRKSLKMASFSASKKRFSLLVFLVVATGTSSFRCVRSRRVGGVALRCPDPIVHRPKLVVLHGTEMSLLFEAASSLLTAATANPDGFDALRYAGAGAVGASLSHTGSVPLDVIKTKIQLEPEKYGFTRVTGESNQEAEAGGVGVDGGGGDGGAQPMSMWGVASAVVAEEGPSGLLTGATPTLVGYAIHGTFKYGLFEALKPLLFQAAAAASSAEVVAAGGGGGGGLASTLGKLPVLLLAGVLAELVASTVLCPLEAARIKIVRDSSSAAATTPAAAAATDSRGDARSPSSEVRPVGGSDGSAGGGGDGGLLSTLISLGPSGAFDGLAAILSKMVPYTAVQLTTYELATSLVLSASSPGAPSGPLSAESAAVAKRVLCATVAAVLSSLVSQPGDSILSEINRRRPDDLANPIKVEVEDGVEHTPRSSQPAEHGASGGVGSTVDAVGNKSGQVADDQKGLDPFSAALAQLVELRAVAGYLGPAGLMRGTQARLAQMLVIVVVQLLIYDYAKAFVGLPVTGSVR